MKTNNSLLEKQPEKLYVGLGSTIDFSRWESFSRNEKIEETLKPDGLVYFEVQNLYEAVNITKKFIDEFKLGASNWLGGLVLDSGMNFKAHISYNGSVWDNEDWRIAKEIIL